MAPARLDALGALPLPFLMHSVRHIAISLASAFADQPLLVEPMVQAAEKVLGRRWRWLKPMCERISRHFGTGVRPRRTAVARFILQDAGFGRAVQRGDEEFELNPQQRLAVPQMVPAEGIPEISIPAIATAGQLAEWLEITRAELDWFADLKEFERKRSSARLRHYVYRPLFKRFGRIRLIEAPKTRLREIQRRILHGILDAIPVHDAVHGFRTGRSIRSFAAPHVGQVLVLRLDLEDFFPSIQVSRLRALFRTIGYPENVADLLAGLCTNATPEDAWKKIEPDRLQDALRLAKWRYRFAHLPQGAPTSPALANLAAYRLDCRLAGLATAAGANYTRYADDLAFSGDEAFARSAHRFQSHVAATILEEGFTVNFHKTRRLRQGVRQHLAGIVVNDRLNVPRDQFDLLKATLHNCVRLGPASQNRAEHPNFRAHLGGRIAHLASVHPERGQRLKAMFDAIQW